MAHLLGFKTKLLIYAGPDYDLRPLDEAEVLSKQLLTQFPNELGEERQKILDEQARIVLCRAQREYSIGEYYYKNKYYTASKAYYQTVVDNWPDTQLAQSAKTKIESTKGKPGLPHPPFDWLVKLLPQENTGAIGNGTASSGIPQGMGSANPGIGTLGGMGSGTMPATPSGTSTR